MEELAIGQGLSVLAAFTAVPEAGESEIYRGGCKTYTTKVNTPHQAGSGP